MNKTIKWHAITPNQYVAWRFFDGMICVAKHLKRSPMPWSEIGKN